MYRFFLTVLSLRRLLIEGQLHHFGIDHSASHIDLHLLTDLREFFGQIGHGDRLSDEGAYGVDPGKHLLSSFGANLTSVSVNVCLNTMT